MTGNRSNPPDPKGVSFLHVHPSETSQSRLAHWPPPHHEREAPAMLKVKHPSSEPVKRAHSRGWRLTRSMFSEFSDDEE